MPRCCEEYRDSTKVAQLQAHFNQAQRESDVHFFSHLQIGNEAWRKLVVRHQSTIVADKADRALLAATGAIPPTAPVVNLVPIQVLIDALPGDADVGFVQRLLDLPNQNGAGATLAWSKTFVEVAVARPLPNKLPGINWDLTDLKGVHFYGLPRMHVSEVLQAQLERYRDTLTSLVCLNRGDRPYVDELTWKSREAAVLQYLGFCWRAFKWPPASLDMRRFFDGPVYMAYIDYLRTRRHYPSRIVSVAFDVAAWFMAENPGCVPKVQPHQKQLAVLRAQLSSIAVAPSNPKHDLLGLTMDSTRNALVRNAHENRLRVLSELASQGLSLAVAKQMHDALLENKSFLEAPPVRSCQHRMLRIPEATGRCTPDCPIRATCGGNRMVYSGRLLPVTIAGVRYRFPEVWGEHIRHHKNDKHEHWVLKKLPYTHELSALATIWLATGRKGYLPHAGSHEYVFFNTGSAALEPFDDCDKLLKYFRKHIWPEGYKHMTLKLLRNMAATDTIDRAADAGLDLNALSYMMDTSGRYLSTTYDLQARQREINLWVNSVQPLYRAALLQSAGVSSTP